MKNQRWLKDKIQLLKQLSRYLLVGGFATALNYGIFFILYRYWNVNYLISSATGFIISVLAGYLFNKKWTFGSAQSSYKLVIKYFLIYLIGLLLSVFLLRTSVEFIGMSPEYANLFSIAFTSCTNFIGLKYLVFKKTVS